MKLIAFDIESWGTLNEYALQPYRARSGDAWLTSAAFHGQGISEVVDKPDVEWLRDKLRICSENKWRIVGWNTPFDVAWLIAMGLREEVLACQWLDAMLLWKHLTSQPKYMSGGIKSYSLKAAVAAFIPQAAGYEKGIDFDPETDIAALTRYNLLDATYTLTLAERFLAELPPQTTRTALIEAACIPMVAESIVEGIRIDSSAAGALDTVLEETANVAYVKLKLDSPDDVTPEVLASPAQLGELLFSKWRLPARKLTDKGTESTDKEVLAELAVMDQRAKLVHEYREANNNRTKFVTAPLESIEYNGDGCTRPQFRIYGTYTGRGTYSSTQGKGKSERQTGVALHQWKRDPAFRKLITPPDGYTLLEFDFAGQEFRWMAVCANDPVMLQMCAPGEDAHAYMGARIAGLPYDKMMADLESKVPGAKDKRQLGKVANLSLQYRTSANRLQIVSRTQYGLSVTDAQAKAIHATYQTTYRAVPRYWNKQIYNARINGFVENLAGRRVMLAKGSEWTRDTKWSYESTAINFPIQSMGADQKYLALMVLRNYLPKVSGHFYFELHDGLFVVVPNNHAQRSVSEIRHLLSNLPYEKAWGLSLPIKFPVDAKMGPSWGELVEVKDG